MNLKLFGKNAIIYSIGTAGLRTTGFLLIPIYTHFLPLNEYGLLATLLLTINFMVTIIDLSLRSGLMRFITDFTKENKLKYLLGSLVAINFAMGIFVTLVALLFLQPLFKSVLHTENVSGYIMLACIAAVVQSISINVTSYYRAKNMGMRYMLLNLSVAGLLILANIFLFIILDAGIMGALSAYIVSYGLVGIFAAIAIFRTTGFGISREALVTLFKFCAPLILASGGFSTMDTTAVYFLSFFTSLENVGIYNLGSRIAQIGSMIIILPFQLAYEPFLFANLDKPGINDMVSKITTYLVLAYTFIAFFIVFIFRDLLSVIAPAEYFSAYYIIFFLLPGAAFSGLFYVGQSLLHVKHRTHITGSTVAVFSLSSILLNYFLIQLWGTSGLIIVYNFVWISIALLLMKMGLKSFPVKLEKKRLAIVSLTFVVLLSAVFLMHNTYSYIYYTLIPALFLLILLSYYFGGFFDAKEKSFINKAINKAGNVFNSFMAITKG